MKSIYFKGFELDLLYVIWSCVLSKEKCTIYISDKKTYELFESFMYRFENVSLELITDSVECNYNLSDIHLKDNRIDNKPLLLTYCKYLDVPYSLNWRNPIITTNSQGKEVVVSRSLLFHDKPSSWTKLLGEMKEEKFLFIGNGFECGKFAELNVGKSIEYFPYVTVEEAFTLLQNARVVITNEGIILGLCQMSGIPYILEADLNRNTNFLLN